MPLGQCQAAIHGVYSQRNLPPDSLVPPVKDGVNYPLGKKRAAPSLDVSSGYAGTASERDVVGSLAAPALGRARPPGPRRRHPAVRPAGPWARVSVR